jgi:AcrR family transcriptional regulator
VSRDSDAVLDATRVCVNRLGLSKVTIDDIVAESGASRATIYRLFPGGRDVLFEAMRVREMGAFFEAIRFEAIGANDLVDLLTRCIVVASTALRNDEHLASMLASERGEVLAELTVDGVPRVINMATAFITPLAEEFVDHETAVQIVEVVARLVISNFLAPSALVDFTDRDSVSRFLATFNFLIRPNLSTTH